MTTATACRALCTKVMGEPTPERCAACLNDDLGEPKSLADLWAEDPDDEPPTPREELTVRDDWSFAVEVLDLIDPRDLDYQSWVTVGMVLKDVGHSCQVWDTWSRRDPDRYRAGVCASKWESFHGSLRPAGIGTLVHLAREQGHEVKWWESVNRPGIALPWDGLAASDDAVDAETDGSEHDGQRSRHALPPLVRFGDIMDDLPPLAPELIGGILRQGHKLTLAGPSKAGKSFALITLAVAIAEGREWLGWPCAQGPVVYVNLEVDGASFLHRVSDVYRAHGWARENACDLYAWNLRGHSCDIAQLADELVGVVAAIRPLAILLDPAYKLNDGDENAARDMARFTRRLDEIATRSGAAMIICHHHSKGSQGGKASRDRASGSGVVARDADALVDLLELDVGPDAREHLFDRLSIERMCEVLDEQCAGWRDELAITTEAALRTSCRERLDHRAMNALIDELDELQRRTRYAKPIEVSPTLREFSDGFTRRVWYMHPVHIPAGEELKGALAEGSSKTAEERKHEKARRRNAELETAFEALAVEGSVKLRDLAEYLDVSIVTARTHANAHGGFEIERSVVTRKEENA